MHETACRKPCTHISGIHDDAENLYFNEVAYLRLNKCKRVIFGMQFVNENRHDPKQ